MYLLIGLDLLPILKKHPWKKTARWSSPITQNRQASSTKGELDSLREEQQRHEKSQGCVG
jgi:hypothetical protein